MLSDRAFLDNVITSTLVFESGGKITRYAGGYSDWLRKGKLLAEKENPNPKSATATAKTTAAAAPQRKKLSYNEQRELSLLPQRIHALEEEISVLQKQINNPDFYSNPFEKVAPVLDELQAKQQALDAIIGRWAELES